MTRSLLDGCKRCSKLWHHSLTTLETSFTNVIFLLYRPQLKVAVTFIFAMTLCQCWFGSVYVWQSLQLAQMLNASVILLKVIFHSPPSPDSKTVDTTHRTYGQELLI
jgi:hypothetical protein